jgi:hypothetical protein
MLLRARDVASVQLITEQNGFGLDSEIYARFLLPRQEGSIGRLERRAYFEAMSAESFAGPRHDYGDLRRASVRAKSS